MNSPTNKTDNLDEPVPITVFTNHTDDGQPTSLLAVQTPGKGRRKKTSLVEQADLIQANVGVLTKLVLDHNLTAYQSRQGLAALAKLILSAPRGNAYVADQDRYHRVRFCDETIEFFLHRGNFCRLTTVKSPLQIIAASRTKRLPKASCSVDTWNERIGRDLVADPVLFVCLCAALSSLLTTWLSWPRLLLALIGPSSVGKNSVQKAVASILTVGDEVQSVSGTTKGLRHQLEASPDRFVVWDELRQVEDPHRLPVLFFDGANGTRRIVSGPSQTMHVSAPLRCGLIVSNELPLAELCRGRRARLDEGLNARYIEIYTDGEHGVFRCLPEGLDAPSFARRLSERAAIHYGAIWDAYVPAVAKQSQRIKKWAGVNLPKLEAEISRDLDIKDRVVLRMIHGMATWAAAGCIAHNLELIQADRATVVAHFRTILKEYLSRQRAGSTPLAERVFEAIVSYIDLNAGNFVPLEEYHTHGRSGIVGFITKRKEEKVFLLRSAAFEDAVRDVGVAAAVRQLRAAGYLQTSSEGHQLQLRMPTDELGTIGPQRRYYAIVDRIRHER